ncbi:MAG: methyltransferase domain-containing protein [Kiritimatiellia bacterium]
MNQLIDRLEFAAKLSAGKKVLDIGGQHPFNHDSNHPFLVAYRQIASGASQYEIVDRQNQQGVKYVADLNTREGLDRLAAILREFQPDVILCMEILEHLMFPFEVMNLLGQYLHDHRAEVFITIPNNGNWILDLLNWHGDHNFAFFRSIAGRFVRRSELGKCRIETHPCMQRYHWYWRLAWLLSFGQPFNWGFLIKSPEVK